MSGFCVVLVRPRDPNNIGACARAMRNFGLSDLRLVEPYAPVWKECVSAVGADDILKNARLCATLDEALQDTHFSLAATALRNRVIEQEIIKLPALNERLKSTPEGLTALVFGNEKTGLSNEDIARCSAVLTIPTVSEQPSINLAQAVILTCYELSKRGNFKPLQSEHKPKDWPTDAQKEIFISCIDELFVKASFRTDFTSEQRKALLRRILTQQGMDRWQLFFVKTLAERIKEKLP